MITGKNIKIMLTNNKQINKQKQNKTCKQNEKNPTKISILSLNKRA
jgi:hypothetical protein